MSDRRSAIAAALDASLEDAEDTGEQTPQGEASATPPPPPAPEGDDQNLEAKNPDGSNKEPSGEKNPDGTDKKPAMPPAPGPGETKAPQSWRAGPKAKWATTDPEVRAEVMRREREVERVLGESANARKLAGAFGSMVQPYMARIQTLGIHPLAAAQELFKADHILTTAPRVQRAMFMAQLIQQYEVDLHALNDALKGTADPESSGPDIDGLLSQKLKPFLDFMQQQTRAGEESRAQTMQRMQEDMDTMAANTEKYPFFDEVREDMADVIDAHAKKGLYPTLEQAYTRAIALNPEVAAKVAKMAEDAKRGAAARDKNERARRALEASSSVSGAPTGGSGGVPNVKDRRATIAAAMDQLEGR